MDTSDCYEFTCANCGKRHRVSERVGRGIHKKYCNIACRDAFFVKKRKEASKEKARLKQEKIRRQQPIVPVARCLKCRFAQKEQRTITCGYLFATGTSRLLLHPNGLTADCLEYQPKKRTKSSARKAIETRGA